MTSSYTLRIAAVCALSLIALAGCAEHDREDGAQAVAQLEPPSASPPPSLRPVVFTLGVATSNCNIETVDGRSVDGLDGSAAAGSLVVIEGWVLPEADDKNTALWSIYLQMPDGSFREPVNLERLSRPDLAGRAGVVDLWKKAGVRTSIVFPPWTSGRVGIFFAPSEGELREHCGLGRGIVVSP